MQTSIRRILALFLTLLLVSLSLGAKKVLKDFKSLIGTLQALIKNMVRVMQKVYRKLINPLEPRLI